MRVALALPFLLLACGPIPVDQAERICADRAHLAAAPRGTAEVGVGSGGHVIGGVGITVTSDYLMGRDPAAVYDTCVYQKSGQPPTRPLYSRSDWKG
ncbi:hypothetical protein SAMN05878503_10478 [Cereibacter ovatus]|uniref:Uncharacterized protein n=1 Tax=Cereibacter ovatus TaxID=439529 RepID=A0A285CQ25_9RHOB|nr:hypothetical protein [Cereibacter ovatus]SNX69515.1 hypothetical protein SAMN05878503_10478 [Cereibacter ovatus]